MASVLIINIIKHVLKISREKTLCLDQIDNLVCDNFSNAFLQNQMTKKCATDIETLK